MISTQQFQYGLYSILGILILTVAAQSFTDSEARNRKIEVKDTGIACKGEPIFVDYPYEDGFMDPHECQVQCQEQRPRYIYYSDGRATQCQELPGCLDWGEDHRETCVPKAATKL